MGNWLTDAETKIVDDIKNGKLTEKELGELTLLAVYGLAINIRKLIKVFNYSSDSHNNSCNNKDDVKPETDPG